MTLDDIRDAVQAAEWTQQMVDKSVGKMARLCAGRLRVSDAPAYTLRTLKRELRGFNMTTGEWKEE